MDKISVIVPIYNVEKYLRECIESIIGQTYKNLEIILIDDGSPDTCPKIIDEYASKDNRIKAIHNQNQGYAKTVNSGIKMATGEYIAIVESDDFIEKDMYEKLYSLITEKDCDMVKCNFYNYWTKGNINKASRTPFDKVEKKVVTLKEFPELVKAHPSVWAALYKRNLLIDNNIFFTESPDGAFLDILFSYKAYINSKKICLTSKSYVHYRQDNSTSTVNNPKKLFCICDEYDLLTEYLNKFPDIKPYVNEYKLTRQYRGYKWNLQRVAPEYKKDVLKRFKDTFSELKKTEDLSVLPKKIQSELELLEKNPEKYLEKFSEAKKQKFIQLNINRQNISLFIMGHKIFNKEINHG